MLKERAVLRTSSAVIRLTETHVSFIGAV